MLRGHRHVNILYIDIDSLRRDHLGCYGYHRNTSPTIDRIAAEGIRFDNVYASDVPCHPSRTALWSGRHGLVTGVVGHGGTACEPYREGADRAWAGTYFSDGWMKCLRDLDYYTATISSFGERHGCWHWYAGFNEVMNCGKRGNERADEVAPMAIDWLKRNGTDRKWFLHVNVWDPHTPYRTPEAYGDPFADEPLPDWMTPEVVEKGIAGYGPHSALEPHGFGKEDLSGFPRAPEQIDSFKQAAAWFNGYDTGIRYADDHIAKILETLTELGVMDDTIIMISADHGENLGELNVWGDHQTADEYTCNVPLIVRWPGADDLRGLDSGLHYQFDWAATLVEKLGGTVPEVWSGQPFADGEGRDYLVLSQGAWAAQRGVRFAHDGADWLMLRTYHDGYKDLPPLSLYNLSDDVHLQNDVAASRPDVANHASRLLDDWRGAQMAENGRDIDPLMTVIQEGGPFHCRGQLKDYLERLRATGRSHHADTLAARHPGEIQS